MQVGGLGARGGPSALNEHGLEPGGSPAQASRPALASTFVVARTQASPGAQMCSAGEPAHVGANLRQDDLGAQFTDPWDSTQLFDSVAKAGKPSIEIGRASCRERVKKHVRR